AFVRGILGRADRDRIRVRRGFRAGLPRVSDSCRVVPSAHQAKGMVHAPRLALGILLNVSSERTGARFGRNPDFQIAGSISVGSSVLNEDSQLAEFLQNLLWTGALVGRGVARTRVCTEGDDDESMRSAFPGNEGWPREVAVRAKVGVG